MTTIRPAAIVFISGPTSDGVLLDMGSEADTMGLSLAIPQNMGSKTDTMVVTPQPLLSTGQQTDTENAPSLAGSGTHPQGSETDSFGFTQGTTVSEGSETQGTFTASATASVNQFTTTATPAIISGSTTWSTPTNAQGDFNDTVSTFSVTSGVALTTADATLLCSGLVVPATPSGFTRTKVEIVIRHRWELDIALRPVDSAQYVCTVLDSTLTISLAVLFNRNSNQTQSTLIQEVFDITSSVTEAQLAEGVVCLPRGIASLSTPLSGDMSVNIDGVHLRATFVRTGIT